MFVIYKHLTYMNTGIEPFVTIFHWDVPQDFRRRIWRLLKPTYSVSVFYILFFSLDICNIASDMCLSNMYDT